VWSLSAISNARILPNDLFSLEMKTPIPIKPELDAVKQIDTSINLISQKSSIDLKKIGIHQRRTKK
jgi:hypothetical protein